MSRLDALAKGSKTSRRRKAPVSCPGPGYGGRPREIQPIDRHASAAINTAAAPLEWLAARGKLETTADDHGAGMIRFAVAQHVRRLVEGSHVSSLKSADLERISIASTAGRPIPDFRLDCMQEVGRLRESMSADLFRILTDVVVEDLWIWEGRKPRAVRAAILHLHEAIDCAAVALDYITADQCRRRWSVQ